MPQGWHDGSWLGDTGTQHKGSPGDKSGKGFGDDKGSKGYGGDDGDWKAHGKGTQSSGGGYAGGSCGGKSGGNSGGNGGGRAGGLLGEQPGGGRAKVAMQGLLTCLLESVSPVRFCAAAFTPVGAASGLSVPMSFGPISMPTAKALKVGFLHSMRPGAQ